MKPLLLLLSLVLFSGIAVSAQKAEDEPVHPIDKILNACLGESKGRVHYAKCHDAALAAWEKDITKTFAELRRASPAALRPYLDRSQQSWEKYRVSEVAFIDHKYPKGDKYLAAKIYQREQIAKARALILEERLDEIKESGK
jgi:uncharacterized protein YecT (DUF1311 family)